MRRDILKGLTARQFREWEMYATLEPFDETRADYRTASIIQVLANIHRGKNQRPYTLQDFLLKFDAPLEEPKRRTQSLEEQFSLLKALAAMHANDQPPPPKTITIEEETALAKARAAIEKAH